MEVTAKLRKPAARKKPAPKQCEEFTYIIGKCALGPILAAFSEFGLVAVMIGKTPAQLRQRLQDRFPKIDLHEGDKSTAAALKRIVAFIEKPVTPPDFQLDIRGTPFQRRVWNEVAKIPVGKTATYSDIAQAIGSPLASRGVGSACTKCLFAIIIPCHRVLRKGDGLAKASRRQIEFLRRESKIA